MLEEGARTVVDQCLKVQKGEKAVLLDDGNDEEIIEALGNRLSEVTDDFELVRYPEPDEHGEEPPERVAAAMRESDVFVAPTKKSLSHTDARRNANEAGARGATLPGINKRIWNSSLKADYGKVERISERVYSLLEDTDVVRITTPSGTDLRFEVDIDYFETDTGIITEPGGFGNLPAGEADGATLNAKGTLVVDHFPPLEGSTGAEIEIEDNRVKAVKGCEQLREKLFSVEGARNVAEFGFGTNPEAELIGKVLQDEKVLGTVHVAFGDNSSYVPEGDRNRVSCPLHWDVVLESPTVTFDGETVMKRGEPAIIRKDL